MDDTNAQDENEKIIEDLRKIIATQNNSIFQLKTLIDDLPGDVYWKDKEGTWLGLNKHCLESLFKMGFIKTCNEQEVVGKTDYQLFDREVAAGYRANDMEVMRKQQELIIEEDTLLPSKEHVILHSTKKTLYDKEGLVAGIVGNTIDITYLKNIETELKKAKEQAEAANHAKSTFIANMSHDIRTPLAGVIGLSEVLKHSLKNPEEREKAHLLHDSGEELLHMLNDILDDVQAEYIDEQDVKKQSFDLHQCINELIRLESPATSLKHLELKAKIASTVPRYIRSDRNKIYRTLLNLLGNAIKFTQSGSITLGLECLHIDSTKAHLKFSVSDTGIGIPEEAQAQVFNRFFKVSSSYKGVYNGHGMGLHIAQSYVELLGGHITLTSKEGLGSTFNFDLECELGFMQPNVVNNELTVNPLLELSGKKLHLLLVEDNLIALKTLEFLLGQKGHSFDSASTGGEALALFQKKHFDLLIMDLGLPDITGTTLSQHIRSHEKSLNKSFIPIIGLTGQNQEATREECINCGMNEVFTKPAQIESLESCIQKLTHNAAQQVKAPLGVDLPDTEKELFHLLSFPLFDETLALTQIPDKKLLISLLKTYLSEQIQQDIFELQVQHEKQNWDAVEKIAHKVKGGMVYLGTEKMRYACQYLERYYKAGHRTLLEPLFQQLLKVNELTILELTQWLQQQA